MAKHMIYMINHCMSQGTQQVSVLHMVEVVEASRQTTSADL
jgi:hypothetical protein